MLMEPEQQDNSPANPYLEGESVRPVYDYIKLYYTQNHDEFSEITSKAGALLGTIASLTGGLIAAVGLLMPAVRTNQKLLTMFGYAVFIVGLLLVASAICACWAFLAKIQDDDVPSAQQVYDKRHSHLYTTTENEVMGIFMEHYVKASKLYETINLRKIKCLRVAQGLLLLLIISVAVSTVILMFSIGTDVLKGVDDLCQMIR